MSLQRNDAKRVGADEPLARYLIEKTSFVRTQNRVKFKVFMPFHLAVSVFRTGGLSDSDIWEIGQEEVAGPRNKTLYGRAEVLGSHVEQVAVQSPLQVVIDEPPPRHANIVGWPDEQSTQQLIAIKLAEMATLTLKSTR